MQRRKLIAFDTSALYRLWDAADNLRLARQAVAVKEILNQIEAGRHHFLYTWSLWWEIEQNPNPERRVAALQALPEFHRYVPLHDDAIATGYALEEEGLRQLDALHVSLAWHAGADLLFTSDDGILHWVTRHSGLVPGLAVVDPVSWNEVL